MIERAIAVRRPNGRLRLPALGAVIAAAVAICPAVWADEGGDALKVRTAAQEFDAGRRAYTARDFGSAADHFENAFRDVPSVEALRLAIRSHVQAGHAARAATLSELALERYASDSGTVTLARETLQEARPKVFKITVRCEPECGVVVDERAVFDDPAPRIVLYVDPGQHEVAATWQNNRGRTLRVQGEAGKETETLFRAPTKEDEPASEGPAAATGTGAGTPGAGQEAGADEARSGLPPGVAYVGIGLSVALTGATIWSGLDTKASPGRDAVREKCLDLGESCALYQEGLDKQKRTNILLGTTIGVAVVTSVIAVAYTDWGPGEAAGQPATGAGGLRVQPGVGWNAGPQLSAVGRF